MAYPSLEQFVNELDRCGELIRVSQAVANELEITDIADSEMKKTAGGKALLFEKPTIDGSSSRFPVAINLFGSERRMARALGLDSIEELSHQVQLILKAKPPTSVSEGWNLLRQGLDLLHARPKKVTYAPSTHFIHRSP